MIYKNISLADQVFEDLEKKILNGSYARGQQISEKKLSEELGVSRTPIREAMSRLLEEDLIEETFSGTVVVGMTDEDMKDIYEVKRRLEAYCMGRAAENITAEEIAELKEIIEEQEYFAQKHDLDKVRDLDTRFHDAIYRASGSRVLNNLLNKIHHKVMRYRRASLESNAGRLKDSVAEHRAIFDAIAAHDKDAAEQALVTHVEHAFDSVLKTTEH